MTSAGKWVLGLLLLVVGAVFVARTVSSDPGSQATVKLPSAETAGADKAKTDEEKAKAAAEAAAKKVAGTVAGDVSCKKACIEVNEVANDAVTTAKLAPGSVTLSKLAFEVPNLNELENEINARKASEAAVKAANASLAQAQAEAAAAGAKNDAAITAAASNGLTAEAAARSAGDEALGKQLAAGDADLLGKLNKEIADRGAADDVQQGKLNLEINERRAEFINLKGELANPNQVDGPVLAVNNNEIVTGAVQSNSILDRTILAKDLVEGAVTTFEILNGTIKAEDVTTTDADALTGANIKDNSLTTSDLGTASVANDEIAGDAVTTDKVFNGTLKGQDVTTVNDDALTGANIKNDSLNAEDINTDAVDTDEIKKDAVTTDEILNRTIGTLDITANAVTAFELADDSVDTLAIQDDAVTNDKLDSTTGAEAVNTNVIRDSAVTTSKIAAGNVTTSRLEGQDADAAEQEAVGKVRAVTAGKLGDDAVINRTIKDGAVTGAKIANLTITAQDLVGSNVDNATAGATRAVTAETIGDNAVTNRAIGNSSIDIGKLSTDIVTEAELTSLKTALLDTTPPSVANPALVDFNRVANVPDDIRNKKASDLDCAGTTTCVQDDEIESVSGSKVDGAVTEAMHAAAADLATNATTAATANDVACGAACVSDSEISDVAFSKVSGVVISSTMLAEGAVEGGAGGAIKDGTITAADLAGVDDADPTLPGAQGVIAGAVTSEKILDLTIEARDLAPDSIDSSKIGAGQVDTEELAAGAVTTDKQTANVASSVVGTASLALTSVALTDSDASTTAKITPMGATASQQHVVELNGQFQAQATPVGGEVITVSWVIIKDGAPVGPEYHGQLTAQQPTLAGSVNQLLPTLTVPGPTEGTEATYQLRVTATASALGGDRTVTLTNAVLTAVDLGRRP